MNMRYPAPGPNMRLSDAERSAAMSTLGRAFAEGRLTIDQYDERCQKIAEAEFHRDLDPLFSDIPRFSGQATGQVDKLYSAQEIESAYREGRNIRLGLLGLTTIGGVVGAAVAASALSFVFMALIPTMWVLLYIMKVGPKSWYVPSARAVDKQRLRELRTTEQLRAAELRLQNQEQLEALRAERRAQTAELTNKAMGFVNKALERGKK
ncbi:DUF1707 domain-containing protein [Corynebacterium sp.]|uniref:DUF1707 SHOCT-like domain-containing protein n=1 Tax=Corynebacterium sp. TaxID=1720 RepID=UPI0019CF0420|nr:DUF1707 domain-containing protein [Corynebacterium sp.]HHU68250.1 DUF1707 domain-containing protein [Corynebacterium sp.]